MTQGVQGLPMLHHGVSVAEAGNWQRFLIAKGYRDQDGNTLLADEQFGRRTEFATMSYQAARRLPATGRVDGPTRAIAKGEGFIPFIQAKNYTPVREGRSVRLIVIHTMEYAEKLSAAEDVALWFAGRTKYAPPPASAHYCVDPDSIVQCVRDRDVAWHAPGANHDGIGIELAGKAGQSIIEWHDASSQAILRKAARLCQSLIQLHDLPTTKLTKTEILSEAKGLCGHHDITVSYPGPKRDHWDPGPNFPWTEFLAMIDEANI